MKKISSVLTLLASLPLYAGTMSDNIVDNAWFGAIGTGYSWSLLPGINNPNPSEWDASVEGYNSSLGNRGFYTFEAGKQIQQYIDVSLLYLNHETFNYQMFQQGFSDTEGFTGGRRNRYFNLNNRALLVNGSLHSNYNWCNVCTVGLSPFVGAGIGYALNQIDNFYTVGTIIVAGATPGTNTAIGSTSSIGNPVSSNNFAWQASAGLNVKPPISHLSFDIGYRYYDGGNFSTSNTIYADSQGMLSATPWAGKVSTNQLFIDFKYTL